MKPEERNVDAETKALVERLLQRFKSRHHTAVSYDVSEYPTNSKLSRLWSESDKAEVELRDAFATALERAHAEGRKPDLGGASDRPSLRDQAAWMRTQIHRLPKEYKDVVKRLCDGYNNPEPGEHK